MQAPIPERRKRRGRTPRRQPSLRATNPQPGSDMRVMTVPKCGRYLRPRRTDQPRQASRVLMHRLEKFQDSRQTVLTWLEPQTADTGEREEPMQNTMEP